MRLPGDRVPTRLGAVVVTALLAAGLAGAAGLTRDPAPAPDRAATAAATDPSGCADVLLLGLRGSGQAGTTARPGGSVLGVVLDRWAADAQRDGVATTVQLLGDGATAPRALRGEARAATPSASAVTRAAVRAWEAPVAGLRDAAATALHDARAACPGTPVLLAGYGQGASAAHRLLVEAAAAPDLDGLLAGAVLVGDGDRAPGTAAALRGAPRADDAARGVHSLLRGTVADVPAPARHQTVWSVCTRGDVVCDLGATPVRDAVARHRSYASGTGAARLAATADAAWRRTALWVRAVPDQQVGAALGAPLDQALQVQVAGSERQRLTWSGATGLPPGVQLSEDGRLVGTPSQAGTFQVGYTVANTRPGVAGSATGLVDLTVLDVAPTTISAGGQHTCAIQQDGSLWCWGRNANGQLGTGTRDPAASPVAVAGTRTWDSVAAGGGSTCAITTDQKLFCWGVNNRGQLGDGTRTTRTEPHRTGEAADWTQVSAGWFGACGVRADHTAWCWGDNTSHQVARGPARVVTEPTQVPGTDWRSLAVGGWNVCGVKVEGTLWCWGRNTFGQDGVGGALQVDQPTQVGTATDWRSVSASWSHTCGLSTTGQVRCFGRNDDGQVGDGTTRDRIFPQVVDLPAARAVSVGAFGSCAITQDDALWCWGSDRYGFLADGANGTTGPYGTAERRVLAPQRSSTTLTALSSGWLHACGLDDLGAAVCWGDNEDGQLGDGTTTDAPTATAARWR